MATRRARKTTRNTRNKKREEEGDSEPEDNMEENHVEESSQTPAPPQKRRRLSTPSSSKSLQFEESVVSTPTSGRKSLSNQQLLEDQMNDDEHEKKQNKKRRQRERRRMSVFPTTDFISATAAPATNDSRVASATHTLTAYQLDDLFKNCMKLSTENKINVKNTWQLNLIDYIDEVIETTVGENEVSNFQVASVTLDASVKIYSYRVDSVHSETYKVLGGLSRADGAKRKHDEEEAETENNGEQQEEGGENTQKKPKRVRHGSNTLEQNINNLNVKKFDYAYSIEPLYHKTSGDNTQYDVGSAESLLLNNLFVSESCELMLDAAKYNCIYDKGQTERVVPFEIDTPTKVQERTAEEVTADGGIEAPIPTDVEVTDFVDRMETDEGMEQSVPPEPEQLPTQPIPTQGLESSQIIVKQQEENEKLASPSVVSFDKDLIQVTIMQSRRESEEHVKNIDALAAPGGFDDDGDDSDGEQECLLDVDFGGNDMPEDVEEGMTQEIQPQSQPSQTLSVEETEDMLEFDNEYTFMNTEKQKGNQWAGVDHWSFSKSKSKRSKTGSKKRKRATKTIDFLEEVDDIDFKKAFEIDKTDKKSSISIADRTLKTQEKKNHLLPEDVHYDISSLERPFSVPNLFAAKRRRRVETEVTVSIQREKGIKAAEKAASGSEDASDPVFDDITFGGAGLFDDDDHTEQLDHPVEPMPTQRLDDSVIGDAVLIPTQTQEISEGLKLIEAPAMVEKLNIKYATRAKKVDVKALKDHLWSEIAKEESEDTEAPEAKSFADVVSSVRTVPPRTPEKGKQAQKKPADFSDVSVPFCFICLLHLANEQGLEITGKEDLSDFSIKRPTAN